MSKLESTQRWSHPAAAAALLFNRPSLDHFGICCCGQPPVNSVSRMLGLMLSSNQLPLRLDFLAWCLGGANRIVIIFIGFCIRIVKFEFGNSESCTSVRPLLGGVNGARRFLSDSVSESWRLRFSFLFCACTCIIACKSFDILFNLTIH